MTDHTPIPQPPTTWPLGNLLDMDLKHGVLHLGELAKEHGPLFRLDLPGEDLICVSSRELVDELCDESRFDKKVHAGLREVRGFAGDGLFTAETAESNWGAAHRILMPAFGPAALRSMFDGMADIGEQLMLKWERQGPGERIDVADTTTRLTLDTIALCSFSHRFNSFYTEDTHPYVAALVRGLLEADARTGRLPLHNRLSLLTAHRFEQDTELMHRVADEIISDRRTNPLPDGRRDILDTMLTATDPQTGERLSDENVRLQMVTFLGAGHETTSGLLTFAMYELMRNPEVMAGVQAEVDAVCGTEAPRFEQLSRLGSIDRVLKETLRLWPTAPAFGLTPLEESTTLGGRYEVRRGQTLLVLVPQLQRDPAVWGDDAESFDPDRFAFDRARELPPNAWKPFGNGQRSCIGRGFALQEAALFLAMLLQRFDVTPADPDYELNVKHTLTMKPDGLFMHVRRRDTAITAGVDPTRRQADAQATAPTNGVPLTVLFGSNAGTSEAFAQRIATDAAQRGYTATLRPLDHAAGELPTDGAVVVVSSSYEGRPPDNAGEFVSWLEQVPDGSLSGARFAVFGNGNSDWASTYQAVPAAIDGHLARAGAQRLVERGVGDARGDLFGAFDDWYDGLWEPVGTAFGIEAPAPVGPGLQVEVRGATREPLLRQHRLQTATVTVNRELVDTTWPGARSKRHLEIALPPGETYRAGDYLAVLAANPAGVVDRVLSRFGVAHDASLTITAGSGGHTFLPTDTPMNARELLADFVELSQPASRRQIATLAEVTVCPPHRVELQALADDDQAHAAQVLKSRVTVLDLLERYPACQLEFTDFVAMLAPLTPRQYSISSSPRWDGERVTLTVAVLEAPALAGTGVHEGVASTYLARTRPGTRVAVTVRPSTGDFHPPASLDTPMVMVCAGTGLAPFRGFLQDRAIMAQQQGVHPAPALLFFGCDGPDVDYLYRDELAAWAEQGIVDVRPAFSQIGDGAQYVQDRLWADRGDVIDLVERGAMFYVCGDGRRMAPAVFDTCTRMYREVAGVDGEEAEAWIRAMQHEHGRYLTDIFA